jgi:hypothetical protein
MDVDEALRIAKRNYENLRATDGTVTPFDDALQVLAAEVNRLRAPLVAFGKLDLEFKTMPEIDEPGQDEWDAVHEGIGEREAAAKPLTTADVRRIIAQVATQEAAAKPSTPDAPVATELQEEPTTRQPLGLPSYIIPAGIYHYLCGLVGIDPKTGELTATPARDQQAERVDALERELGSVREQLRVMTEARDAALDETHKARDRVDANQAAADELVRLKQCPYTIDGRDIGEWRKLAEQYKPAADTLERVRADRDQWRAKAEAYVEWDRLPGNVTVIQSEELAALRRNDERWQQWMRFHAMWFCASDALDIVVTAIPHQGGTSLTNAVDAAIAASKLAEADSFLADGFDPEPEPPASPKCKGCGGEGPLDTQGSCKRCVLAWVASIPQPEPPTSEQPPPQLPKCPECDNINGNLQEFIPWRGWHCCCKCGHDWYQEPKPEPLTCPECGGPSDMIVTDTNTGEIVYECGKNHRWKKEVRT